MAFQRPQGTQDIKPTDVASWQYVERIARDVCRSYRFQEIRTPIFEFTELFQRGVGETTDIVEKEMYNFTDRSDRKLTLRPEGTAGTVRAYVENKMFSDPDVTKLYYIGPMFRYERKQAGRYRQFHQFGIEAIGSIDPILDAEVIALGYDFYKKVGLQGVTVDLNSVGTPAVREKFREQLLEFLNPIRSELCGDCQKRIDRNPLRVLDCKVDQHRFAGAPSIVDALDDECNTHFAAVQQHLQAMGVPFTINPRLVRGLDYYTHTAFEYKCAGLGAIDTIGGGGRYNGLVADIGGPDQPGVGLGIGLERTVLLLADQQVEHGLSNAIDAYVIALGEASAVAATTLIHELRGQGFIVERDYQARKMKAQFKAADRHQARFTAILGDDELERGEIALKNMTTTEQIIIPLEQVAHYLRGENN